MSQKPLKKLLNLYEEAIYGDNPRYSLIRDFWGALPNNMSNILPYLKQRQLTVGEFDENVFNSLKKIITKTHYHFGVCTRQIQDVIASWSPYKGTIEMGHQPLYLGGSGFLFGKVAFGLRLSKFLNNQTIPAILFLGDHDQMQNELLITRFPQVQSHRGLELKHDNFSEEYHQEPISYLKKEKEVNLLNHLEKIRGNYRELFKYSKIKGHFHQLFKERLDHALNLLYDAYLQSENTFGDFIGRFWAHFLIIENKSPLLLLRASDIELRKLMLPYYEELLQEDNRTNMINILNKYHFKIKEAGYSPGLPLREKDYVPFFLECPNNCKAHSRIRLLVNGAGKLTGKCPSCSNSVEINYNAGSPDISDYVEYLSPRVDSRSIIINKLMHTFLRVTGGGETRYYAQIIPFMRSRKDTPPLILKAPRVYYNTPWAEKTSKFINFDKLNTLHNSETFIRMGQLAKANNFNDLRRLIVETKQTIQTTLQQLEMAEQTYKEKLSNGKSKQLLRKLDLIQLYLSQAYGKYEKGKIIQEVSWNWIDLAVLTGMNDYIGFFSRSIKSETPLAPTFFLSAGHFN